MAPRKDKWEYEFIYFELVMFKTSFIDKCMTAMAMVMRGNNESMVRKQFDWLIFSNISTNKKLGVGY